MDPTAGVVFTKCSTNDKIRRNCTAGIPEELLSQPVVVSVSCAPYHYHGCLESRAIARGVIY